MIARAALATLLAFAAAPAAAQSAAEAFLSVCGNPKVSAREAAAAALNLGAAMIALDAPDQAVAAYDRALQARPGWALAYAGRAGAREKLADLPGAAVDWNLAVQAAPDDPAILGGRGAFRLTAGNPTGALEDFDRARARSPRDRDLTFNRALALAELGRDAEAEAAFTSVLQARPDDVGARLNRARLRAGQNPQGALEDFSTVIAAQPKWSQPLVERGALLESMGRVAEAEEDYRRAWELGHRSDALTERITRMGG